MKKQKKHLLCQEYNEIINKHPLVLVMHYNNLVNNYISLEDTKVELNNLMKSYYQNVETQPSVCIKVIKNNLIKHTIKNTRFSLLSSLFAGPTLLLYSNTASVEMAKIILQWKSMNSHLQFLGGKFDNELISISDFIDITQLPSQKEHVLFQTISLLENSMSNIVNVLSESQNRLHLTLKEFPNNIDNQ